MMILLPGIPGFWLRWHHLAISVSTETLYSIMAPLICTLKEIISNPFSASAVNKMTHSQDLLLEVSKDAMFLRQPRRDKPKTKTREGHIVDSHAC